MAATTLSFRYSNDEVATSEAAKAFSWENPVPVNRFWDSFEYPVARNFLGNFSDQELQQLPIDPNSTDDQREKLQLALQLLQDKQAREESAISPPHSLYEKDYQQWYSITQGIYVLEDQLDLPEAEVTLRLLVDKADKSTVVPQHLLAEYLVKVGKYKEAEDTAKPVLAWMDAQARLGKFSPQSISARRLIAQAVWLQGPSRRADAEALISEIKGIVNEMTGGKFEVYQKEERMLNEAMLAKVTTVV